MRQTRPDFSGNPYYGSIGLRGVWIPEGAHIEGNTITAYSHGIDASDSGSVIIGNTIHTPLLALVGDVNARRGPIVSGGGVADLTLTPLANFVR